MNNIRSIRLVEMQTERAELRNESVKRKSLAVLELATNAFWTIDVEKKQAYIAECCQAIRDLRLEASKPLEQFHLEGEF